MPVRVSPGDRIRHHINELFAEDRSLPEILEEVARVTCSHRRLNSRDQTHADRQRQPLPAVLPAPASPHGISR